METRHLQNDHDVEQILRIAVQLPGGHEELGLRERLEISARELGVTPQQLAEAEKRYAAEKSLKADMEAYVREAKWGFVAHLIPYIAVNSFLTVMSLKDGEFWFIFPLAFWGIGLIAHAAGVFNQRSEEFRTEFKKWREKKNAEVELTS
jgi:hypothetical protein